jgi:hypothetical protein
MRSLSEALSDPAVRRAAARDGARLVEDEMRAKGGVSGLALRAALKGLTRVRPTLVETTLDSLLPQFGSALDPLWTEAAGSGDADGWFRRNGRRVAEALLAVTDARAQRSTHAAVVHAYRGLRAQALPHVEAAVLRLPPFIRRHTGG